MIYRTLRYLPYPPIDESNPLFTYDPNKCVLCGRCVWECRKFQEKVVLGFAHRGFDRVLTTFGDEPIGDKCLDCAARVKACPTGALGMKGSIEIATSLRSSQ